MARRLIDALLVVVASLLSLALAIAANVASSLLPAAWTANKALVWSIVAVLAAATVAVAIWRTVAASGTDRRPPEHSAGPRIRAGRDVKISIENLIRGDAYITDRRTKKRRG
jgi:membrane protein implicated in regulation of membrane protease activity